MIPDYCSFIHQDLNGQCSLLIQPYGTFNATRVMRFLTKEVISLNRLGEVDSVSIQAFTLDGTPWMSLEVSTEDFIRSRLEHVYEEMFKIESMIRDTGALE